MADRRPHTGGPWGTGLLLLGVALTAQGGAYVASDRQDLRTALAWVDHGLVPISGWGLLWVAAGLWSIIRALTPPQRYLDLVPALSVLILWAAFYTLHWLIFGLVDGLWSRGWIAAVLYVSFAGVLASFGYCVNPPKGRPRRE